MVDGALAKQGQNRRVSPKYQRTQTQQLRCATFDGHKNGLHVETVDHGHLMKCTSAKKRSQVNCYLSRPRRSHHHLRSQPRSFTPSKLNIHRQRHHRRYHLYSTPDQQAASRWCRGLRLTSRRDFDTFESSQNPLHQVTAGTRKVMHGPFTLCYTMMVQCLFGSRGQSASQWLPCR